MCDIAGDAAAIIPEGMMIEFVESQSAGARTELYRDLIRYLDEQVSIAVAGQTLSSQTGEGGGGSYALDRVHDTVRRDIERSDARQLAQTLRRDIVIPIIVLNRGPRDAYPRVVIEREDPADIDLTSQALERLVPLGLRVRADEVRAALGLEAPADDDEVLAPPAQPTAPAGTLPGGSPSSSSSPLPGGRPGGGPRDAIDDAVADALAADAWEPLMEPIIEPILAAAHAADGDAAAFRAALPEVLGAMDDAELARTIRRLIFGAQLSGAAGLTEE